MDPITKRYLILAMVNLPIVYGLWTIFFDGWSDFMASLLPNYYVGYSFMNYESNKLLLFILLVGLIFYGEYRFFFSANAPENSTPKISRSVRNGLTFRSTRTAPALPSALSLVPSSSAPLVTSVQAGPVTFLR